MILACEKCGWWGPNADPELEDVSGVAHTDYTVLCGACRLLVDPFKDARESTVRAVGVARLLNGDGSPGRGVDL